jgi:hypothetical protein
VLQKFQTFLTSLHLSTIVSNDNVLFFELFYQIFDLLLFIAVDSRIAFVTALDSFWILLVVCISVSETSPKHHVFTGVLLMYLF